MPFLTEELWQHMDRREDHEALIIATWPKPKAFDVKCLTDFVGY